MLYCKKDTASLSRSRNMCVKHVRETRCGHQHENYLLFSNCSRNTSIYIRIHIRPFAINAELQNYAWANMYLSLVPFATYREWLVTCVIRPIFSCEIFWRIWSRLFVTKIWRKYLHVYHTFLIYKFNLWQVNSNSLLRFAYCCIYTPVYVKC